MEILTGLKPSSVESNPVPVPVLTSSVASMPATAPIPHLPTTAQEAHASCPQVPPYYAEALVDAERLLKYAAEIGMEVDPPIRGHILQARTACSSSKWTEETAANMLSALTALTSRLKPVTASTLASSTGDTRAAVNTYLLIALCLAIVIVPFSVASFMTTAISNAIRQDIVTANELTVRLRAQLGPLPSAAPAPVPGLAGAAAAPPATNLANGVNSDYVITELQQFASTTRAIDARARQLNVLVFKAERDPFAGIRKDQQKLHDKFQLPAGLPNLAVAANERTLVYQDVRYFAQNLLDDVSFFYGAMGTCILPVLYALLGTCAYLLRNFEQQLRTRTYSPTRANSARFLIAAIGGAVVGLFKNFNISDGASIPPLAIAFLIGYAVDVFFSFLEGIIQSFTRNTPTSSTAPTPPPIKAA